VTDYAAPKFHYLAGARNLDAVLSRSEPVFQHRCGTPPRALSIEV